MVNIHKIFLSEPPTINPIIDYKFPLPKKYHFVYHVTEDELSGMRTTKTPMESDIFDDIWICSLYVNGIPGVNNFVSFYIIACKWPAYVKKIHAKWKVVCEQTGDVASRDIAHYRLYAEADYQTRVNGQSKGIKRWFPTSKLTDCKSLTFIVDVEITDYVLKSKDDIHCEEITDLMKLSKVLNTCRESSSASSR